MFALHHPRGVFCAQASHKVNFKEYPPPAEFCGRNLSALRHALKCDGVQVQECGGLFDVEHTMRARFAPRDPATAGNAGRLLPGALSLLVHVINSELSRTRDV